MGNGEIRTLNILYLSFYRPLRIKRVNGYFETKSTRDSSSSKGQTKTELHSDTGKLSLLQVVRGERPQHSHR